MANHVVFVSPYIARSQYNWESVMEQAVGRVRRYGQAKDVHIWHCLMAGTIDVNVLQDRSGGVLVSRGGDVVMVPRSEVTSSDVRVREGLALDEAPEEY